MTVKARTLIASEYSAKERAHFALSYEFCRIIQEADDAHVIAPGLDNYISRNLGRFLPPHDTHNVQHDFNRLVNGVRKGLGLKNAPVIEPVSLTQDYELFVYVAWSPQSLVELSRISDWRKRCKTAVLYLFELWTSSIEQDEAYLKLMDEFDHVFMLHNESVPLLRSYIKTPSSFLLTGIDALTFAPVPLQPRRSINVYSIGNRAPAVHQQLVKLSRESDFFYIYDTLASTGSSVKDWGEHRLLMANIIKRSRYFISYNPASLNGDKAAKIRGEQVIPSRVFEGASAGAILLGTAPECPEFNENFDWPGAVIWLPPDARDVAERLMELDADQNRLDRIRRDNVVNCLLRHDWVYRWESILSAVGMQPRDGSARRKAALLAAANQKAGKQAFLSMV
jgi:hypothetical protein